MNVLIKSGSPESHDLLCDEAVNSPASFYAKLRNIDPVYWNPRWNGWILTSYNAVATAHRLDGKKLSANRFSGPFASEMRATEERYTQLLKFLPKIFMFKDPPDHTRLRRLTGKALTPRSVELLRPRVKELVRELIEPMQRSPYVDFLSDFAYTFPFIVMAEFIGIPSDARHALKSWSTDILGVTANRGGDASRMQRAECAITHFVDFIRPIIQDRKIHPRNDLLTRIVAAEESGDFLSEEEVIASTLILVVAGHETTTNLLANGLVAFAAFPDQWEKLRRDLTLARNSVEEILRYDGPVRAVARWATEPFELCGHQMGSGDRLLLVDYAANRDPEVFPNPNHFDVARHPNKHVGFGFGIHSCAGAALARLEAQETFTYLASKFKRLELREDELIYDRTIASRTLASLNVTFRV